MQPHSLMAAQAVRAVVPPKQKMFPVRGRGESILLQQPPALKSG